MIIYLKFLSTKIRCFWRKVKGKYFDKPVKCDLLVLDDIFPHLLSAFRIAEYNRYLSEFSESVIYSTAKAFPIINESRSLSLVVQDYETYYPQFRKRVFELDTSTRFDAKLAYMIFINNAYGFVETLEKNKIPFVFTLYPGGGFALNTPNVDQMLMRVFLSPYFRKVIVTQKVTYDYLLERELINSEKVEFIYGGVFPSDIYKQSKLQKKRYKNEKQTFDICFVANKYMSKGIDKGYDTFISVAEKLVDVQDMYFHVVGSFDELDIDISLIKDKITFYGKRYTDFFPDFYSKMDIILSPNIPFILNDGAFDGFPTGCCVEAALSEVAVFCTDILNQNIYFQNRENIVLISTDADRIVQDIFFYYRNTENLYLLAKKGEQAFGDIFSIENQISLRLKVLHDSMIT